MNNNININYEGLRNKIEIIESDITRIEDILKQVEIATTSIDNEKIWVSKEKTKMDSDYIPYVKRISINVPIALRKHLNHIRKALSKYEETEEEIVEVMEEELEDLKAGD